MDHKASSDTSATMASVELIRLYVAETATRRVPKYAGNVLFALLGGSCCIESSWPPSEYS